MSNFASFREKYGSANLNDFRVLAQLREDLEKIKAVDIQTVEDHVAFLSYLKQFRNGLAEGDKLKGANYPELLKSLLSVGADSVYSNPLRFMYELIQNVDDCLYADPSNAKLDVLFDTSKGQIIFTYNEIGFTPYNVFAITGIAEAAKNVSPDKIEIGEKGIGFKSVFGVAEKVYIQSGKFSFELHRDNFTIPVARYEDYQEISGTRMTLFVPPKVVESVYRSFANEYCKKDTLFNKNPVLFLNKLTEVYLHIDSFRNLKFTVDRSANDSGEELFIEENVTVAVEYNDHKDGFDINNKTEVLCTRYSMPIHFDAAMCQARYGKTTAFTEKNLFLQVVVPSPEYLLGHDAIHQGTLYSFMPTQVRIAAPIACHIPFKLNSSREYVDSQGENTWFKCCITGFEKMLADVYIDLAWRHHEQAVNYLLSSEEDFFSSDHPESKCLKRTSLKGRAFWDLPLYFAVDEAYYTAQEVYCFSPNEEVMDPIQMDRLLGEKRHLFIPPENKKSRVPGVEFLRNINDRLFARAIDNPAITEEALDILSRVEGFPFKERLEVKGTHTYTLDQVKAISKYATVLNAYNGYAATKLSKGVTPNYSVAFDGNETIDVRCAGDKDNPLDAGDFDLNAKRYLDKIDYHCITLDLTTDRRYFISKNILVLSEKNPINALARFCSAADENGVFSATLKLKSASQELNVADETLDNAAYLSLLQKVRNSIVQAFGQTAYRNYIRLINEASSNADRYIDELIQNADDCTFPEGIAPSFVASISEDKRHLTTNYNEIGFTKHNIRSITAIGESTKKQLKMLRADEHIEIGEKGIGFKAVFSVADSVEIHSNGFDFALSASRPTIPQILEEKTSEGKGTTMTFTMKQIIPDDFFSTDKVLRLCLCLRQLRHLELGKTIVDIKDETGKRTIYINRKAHEYRVIPYTFEVNNKELLAERENQRYAIGKEQRVTVYIPIGLPAQKECYLYAGLPTRIKTSNISLIVDAPFELTTARDDIVDNRWNEMVKAEVYNALIYAVEVLRQKHGNNVLAFLPARKEVDGRLTFNLFTRSSLNDARFVERLRGAPILSTLANETYVAPNQPSIRRLPIFAHYLVSKGKSIPYPANCIVKQTSRDFTTVYDALQVREISLEESVGLLGQYHKEFISDEVFRKAVYEYFFKNSSQLSKTHREKLKAFAIIPVKGVNKGDISFVSWSDRIYTKAGAEVSTDANLILAVNLLPKEKYEQIFGETINELNAAIEETLERQQLVHKLETLKGHALYNYLLELFNKNRPFLNRFKPEVTSRLNSIPLKNELGNLVCQKIYYTYQDSGYYFGAILPKHIAHRECRDLSIYLGCKAVEDVTVADLDISHQLSAEDIESFQDDLMRYGMDILSWCKRKGLISEELIQTYQLDGFSNTSIEYDPDFLNQPITNPMKFQQHMNELLKNPLCIEKRQVPRTVDYVVPKKGEPYLFSNSDARRRAIAMYSPSKGCCVCQMCKQAKENKFIRVNNLLKDKPVFWEEFGIALCLECSKVFEELRENTKVRKLYWNELRRANPNVKTPVEISVGDKTLVFTQTHIAEIQALVKDEYIK